MRRQTPISIFKLPDFFFLVMQSPSSVRRQYASVRVSARQINNICKQHTLVITWLRGASRVSFFSYITITCKENDIATTRQWTPIPSLLKKYPAPSHPRISYKWKSSLGGECTARSLRWNFSYEWWSWTRSSTTYQDDLGGSGAYSKTVKSNMVFPIGVESQLAIWIGEVVRLLTNTED